MNERLKRLKIRAWRRGTRELDLITGPFADALGEQDQELASAFEALLEEADPDIYAWISGTADAPERHAPILSRVRAFHGL